MKNQYRYLLHFVVLCTCALVVSLSACKTKKIQGEPDASDKGKTELSERCRMKPEPGPCRGAFTRYYYDATKGKCMSFIYGGCEGVVPFETLEDCQAACAQE